MKCFQHSDARSEKLRGRVVFEGDTDLRSFFNELMRLRNKHLVHHENDWMQAYLVAIVTVPGYDPKVSAVEWVVTERIDIAHIERLGRVVDAALAWVAQEWDRQAEAIRAELLTRDYDELIALTAPLGSVGG
jgi:hypothetical protein